MSLAAQAGLSIMLGATYVWKKIKGQEVVFVAKMQALFNLVHYLCNGQLHINNCDVRHHSGTRSHELELFSSAENDEK